MQVKHTEHTEVSKLPSKVVDFSYNLNKNVIQSLQLKLAFLSNLLNSESDLGKTKDILECMRSCMENISLAKSLNI